jgi:protease IV
MDEAIRKAGELAEIDRPARQVRYLERPRSFEDRLLELFVSDFTGPEPGADVFAALAPQAKIADGLAQLRSVLAGPRIQARCLDCPAVAPAPLKRENVSFLAALREWLF